MKGVSQTVGSIQRFLRSSLAATDRNKYRRGERAMAPPIRGEKGCRWRRKVLPSGRVVLEPMP